MKRYHIAMGSFGYEASERPDGLWCLVEEAEAELGYASNREVSLAEVANRLERDLATANALLQARDVCWHCKDCLEPQAPVCERCPLPGDCDDEDCKAEGCEASVLEQKP